MTRSTDDAHARIETHAPRLRRIPASVDDHGLAVIRRAITLRLAQTGELGADDLEMYGTALVHVCGEWMKTQIGGKG